jgi:heme-degrading monooxygenase HmoA
MIVELALITVTPGREAEFEAAYAVATHVLASAKGHLAHELRRSVETPQRYALRVEWATLEDHTVGFRGSPLFAEWRGHLGAFFAAPPVVEHYTQLEPPTHTG